MPSIDSLSQPLTDFDVIFLVIAMFIPLISFILWFIVTGKKN